MKKEIAIISLLIFGLLAAMGISYRMTLAPQQVKEIPVEQLSMDSGRIKVSPTGEVYTAEADEKGNSIKYYKITASDNTFIRQALSASLWNDMVKAQRLDFLVQPSALVQLVVDEEDKGLFLNVDVYEGKNKTLSEKNLAQLYEGYNAKNNNNAGNLSENAMQNAGLININKKSYENYLLFLQLTYAYKNIFEDYRVTERSGEGYMLPEKIEYSFGVFPGRYEYLSYLGEKRVISLSEIGISEGSGNYSELFSELADKWFFLRKTVLSDENIINRIDALAQEIVASEYEIKSGCFVSDDDFSATDYYLDAVNTLKTQTLTRLANIDRYYEIGESAYLAQLEEEFKLADSQKQQEAEISFRDDVYIDISAADSVERVYLCKKGRSGYFFLPSFADKDAIEKAFDKENCISKTDIDSLEFIKSGGLKSVFLTSQNGTFDYIDEAKGNKEPGFVNIYTSDGKNQYSGELSSIKGKGNTSFKNSDKKSYQLNFGTPVQLGGFKPSISYVLQANALDPTRLRNYMAYSYAEDLGLTYTTSQEYTDVYLNGRYNGNYLMLQPPQAGSGTVMDNVGLLFEVNAEDERNKEGHIYFRDDKGMRYEIDYPSQNPEREIALAQRSISAIYSIDGKSGDCDFSEAADIESFVDMYIMDKLFDDPDANYFSTFYYLPISDNRLYAGPVWDYDMSLGNHGDRSLERESGAQVNGLPEYMFDVDLNGQFAKKARNKWQSGAGERALRLLETGIDEKYNEISASLLMDDILWGSASRVYKEMDTYEENLDFLKQSLKERYDICEDILGGEHND